MGKRAFRYGAATVLALLVCLSTCAPCFAAPSVDSHASFWSWLASTGGGNSLIGVISSAASSSACAISSDGRHHGSYVSGTSTAPNGNSVVHIVCSECGETFPVTEDEYQAAYASTVTNIYNQYNTTNINSNGTSRLYIRGWNYSFDREGFAFDYALPDIPSFYVVARSSVKVDMVSSTFTVPVSGRYKFVFSSGRACFTDLNSWYVMTPDFSDKVSLVSCYEGGSKEVSLSANKEYVLRIGQYRNSQYWPIEGELYYIPQFCPYIEGVQLFDPGTSGNAATNTVNTRPTSITGANYGVVGDNNELQIVQGDIVNETNNTYINPATGTGATITDWSYDYSDRSYHLNLDNGTTSTVTYGDEHITITEVDNSSGDTVTNNYTIYYIIDNGCPGDPDDPTPSTPPDDPDDPGSGGSGTTHEHHWELTGSSEPTCILAGRRNYTCSACGAEKSELSSATGHSWTVKTSVNNEYDDDGKLVQQGYTIYKCSTCGEEYRDALGVGPPGSSGDGLLGNLGDALGTLISGILNLIGRVLSKVFDGLIALLRMGLDKLGTIVEMVLSIFEEIPQLFGGFLGFLNAAFPYIPDPIMTVLTFSIIAVCAIGIIKALRR